MAVISHRITVGQFSEARQGKARRASARQGKASMPTASQQQQQQQQSAGPDEHSEPSGEYKSHVSSPFHTLTSSPHHQNETHQKRQKNPKKTGVQHGMFINAGTYKINSGLKQPLSKHNDVVLLGPVTDHLIKVFEWMRPPAPTGGATLTTGRAPC